VYGGYLFPFATYILKRLFFIGEIPMNNLVVPPQFKDMIFLRSQTAQTSSLIVAERFGKRHSDVLRAIEELECSDSFRAGHLFETSYLDKQGQTRKLYNLTWKGFSRLAMGFNGKEAAEWQEKFLDAFEWMQEELGRLRSEADKKEGHEAGRSLVMQDAWNKIGEEQRDANAKVFMHKHRWEQERGRKEDAQKNNRLLTKENQKLVKAIEKVRKENTKLRAELKAAKGDPGIDDLI
jgi:Rha family phage regulatory protein